MTSGEASTESDVAGHHQGSTWPWPGVFHAAGVFLERRLGRLARANLGRGGPRGHHRRHPRAHVPRRRSRGRPSRTHLIVIHHDVVVAPGTSSSKSSASSSESSPLAPASSSSHAIAFLRADVTAAFAARAWDDATDEKTRDRPRTSSSSAARDRVARGFLSADLGYAAADVGAGAAVAATSTEETSASSSACSGRRSGLRADLMRSMDSSCCVVGREAHRGRGRRDIRALRVASRGDDGFATPRNSPPPPRHLQNRPR